MTVDAVVGRVVPDLPYLWIKWLCVDPCGAQVALTRLDVGRQKIETKMMFAPIRMRDADRDGVPFFGPSRRDIRGKSTRHHPQRLAANAERRKLEADIARSELAWADPVIRAKLIDDPEFRIGPATFADYRPIEAEEFDTICRKCATRLRIRIASALPKEVS